MKVISVPLIFLRDYTIPFGDNENWDRTRAAIIPMTLMFAFKFLSGEIYNQEDEDDQEDPDSKWTPKAQAMFVSLAAVIPGAVIAILIRMKLKSSRGPESLIFIYAIIAFVMSVMWIGFTCDIILDLLALFGFITQLPKALF